MRVDQQEDQKGREDAEVRFLALSGREGGEFHEDFDTTWVYSVTIS
ncbi:MULTISPECIES: hypothetical protein [Bradyrhizobium]|jgi:hypothetical protein|nr:MULTISPECIES: hypothetical protein [Bradyrhizobium]